MIHNSQKQSGSALAVIVIILVVALIGTLAFIFWQNSTNKKDDTPTVSDTSTQENTDPYKDWNTYEAPNTKYTIKYPASWQALKETVPGGPYIRNFEPTPNQTLGGYPDGYINMSIQREENDADFKAMTGGYTTTDWYNALGKSKIQSGPVTYLPEEVKELNMSGLTGKSTKAAFTETDEIIYLLRGDALYSIVLYPYGISSDPTVKLMLDSFTYTY